MAGIRWLEERPFFLAAGELQDALPGLGEAVVGEGFFDCSSPRVRSIPRDWQPADSDTVFLYHDDAALFEVFSETRQLIEEESCLISGATARDSAEDNEGRLVRLAEGQKGAEVRARGDDDPFFPRGLIEYLLVRRGLHTVVPDVSGLVSGLPQKVSDARR